MSGRDYTPKPGAIERQYGDVQQDYDLSLRTRLVTTANPWLKRDAAALEAFVTAPVDNATLTENAGAIYGMINADKLIGNFRKMGAATQRAMYGTLTPGQQQVLQQGGYKPPDDDGESFLRRVAGPVGGVVGDVVGGFADVVGTVASPALDAATWLFEQPSHIYRTIRQGDDRSQWVALGGAIVGTAAAVAATAGSGGTFATLGAAGGGALLGGSLGSAATNPSDFIEAFNASWDGEKTFDRPSLRKAEELLGDSRYTNLAADIANATDMPIIDLARALAGQRDVSINSQWAAVEGVIGRFAQKNTPEYQELALKVSTLLQTPMFQEAITTLQNGKISVGRDFADVVGLDPGTGMYQLVSGAVDGTWGVVMDPTLLIGKGAQAWKMQRTAIGVLTAENAAAAANRFRSISDNIGSVRRMHEVVADAVSTGNFNRIRTLAPESAELWRPLQDYRIDLLTKGILKEGEEFTRKHFLDFVTNQQNMIPLMQGYGTVRGAKGVVLRGLNPEWTSFRQMASKVRSFTNGLTDIKAERDLGLILDEIDDDMLRQVISPSLFSELNDPTLRRSVWTTGDEEILRNTPWLWHEPNVAAREAGRKLAVVPGLSRAADALTAMTTMIPVGKSISIVGKHAGRDVHALTELGRYMGMPAYTRKMWAEQILNARSPGVAMNLVTGWLDNALTTAGLRYDDEASAMVDKFLSSFHQAYSGGVTDNLVRDGRTSRVSVFMSEQATDIVMPNLQELRRLASGGFLAKLVGLTDMSVAQAGVNKFWKPGVLLRQGFVMRAAGEEMTNFMLRGGYGALAQEFGARSVAHRNLYEAAVAKRDLGQWRLITDAEHEALAVGPALAHLRPLERMLARYDFTAPISGKIRQYSDWMRDELTYGVALRPSAEKQAGRLERVDNLLSGIAGQSFDDATRAIERGATSLRSAAGGAPLTLEQKLRANLAANADALMFGNQHSWRRMLYGGVHDDLLQAADAFAEQFATVMAKEVGALNNGPADIDRADTIKYRTQDSNAPEGYRDVEYVQLRGQRRRVSSATKDPWYANGVHEQTQRVVGDPLTRDLVTRHLPFVRGGASATDDHIRQTVAAYSSINSRAAKEIVNEFLGAPSREGLLALAERYKSIDPEIARVLREAVGYGDVVFDDVLDAFLRADPKKFTSGLRTRTQRYADSKAPGGFREVETTTQEGLHYIIADLKRAKEDIVSVLDSYAPTVDTARRGAEGYDEASRRFLGQLLRSSDGPGGISMADIERGYRVNSIDEEELFGRFLDDVTSGNVSQTATLETLDALVKGGVFTPERGDAIARSLLGRQPTVGADDLDVVDDIPVLAIDRNSLDFQRYTDEMRKAGVTVKDLTPDQRDDLFRSFLDHFESSVAPGDLMREAENLSSVDRAADVADEALNFPDVVVPPPYPEIDVLLPPGLSPTQRDMAYGRYDQWQAEIDYQNLGRENVEGLILEDSIENLKAKHLADQQAADDLAAPEFMPDENVAMPGVAGPVHPHFKPSLEHFDQFDQRAFPLFGRDLDIRERLDAYEEFGRFLDRYLAGVPDPNKLSIDDLVAKWAKSKAGKAKIASVKTRPTDEEWFVNNVLGELPLGEPTRDDFLVFADELAGQEARLGRTLTSQERIDAFGEYWAWRDAQAGVGTVAAWENSSSYLNDLPASDEFGIALRAWLANDPVQTVRLARPSQQASIGAAPTLTTEQAFADLRNAAQERVQQGRLPVFYDSFNDVEEQLMVTARSLLNDPKYQGTVNLSRRYDDAREGFERGQVQLWEAPSIRPKTTGELPSFEDVVALAPDRGLILDKRDEVEAWLEAAATAEPTDILFAADRGLAEQLAVIDARWRKAPQPQPVRTTNVNRQILDGRFHKNEGLLTPAFKQGSDTRLWTANRRAFNDRMFDPSAVGDGLLEETARAMVDTIRQTWTRGTVETVSPRYTKDVIDEATGEITGVASMYFKEVDGSLTPVPRGTKLRGNESVYDAKGKRLDVLDFRVSQPTDVVTGESGQIMWELTGPMMEDAWDDIAGTRLFLPKDAVKTSIGQALPANDVVPVFRSRVGHVQGTQGLPNITRAEVMAPAKSSTWDNVVRFGFDKVMGPQIEAIARRPMAFHFFQQRYTQNRQWLNVLRDPVVVEKMNKAALALGGNADFIVPVLENTRSLARFDGVAEAATWTDQQTMAFLRGMGADEYAAFLTRSKAKYKTASAKAGRTPEIVEVDVALTKMGRVSHERIVANLHTGATGDELLTMVRSEIGSHALTNKQVFESGKIQEKIDGSEILSKLTDEQWEALRAGEINYRHAHQAAGEYAAEAAINDMMPFIDSHELRTQFAEHGKGLLPFWYAEENFLKRWGRTIALDPTSIRKAQLTYMGLKNSGVVRTDSQGNQYFVYPGSNLLHEAFSKIPFLPSLLPGSGSTMFQSPVESMLPGVNSRFGTPSFSPLVAVPMGMVTTMFPELNPIERALIGDIGAASTGWADVVKQVAPAHIRHTLGAIFNANENTNTRIASAMSAAMAHLEANDQGLPDDADAGQVDAYLDKVRNHARIIVFSQALSGWINPGTTGTLDTGGDNGIMGFGTDDPRGVLNDLYVTMIDNLGMEQGTIEFLKTYPLADLEDIVNPMTPEDVLAYTTGTSVTTSGAQLPATEQALNFWEINDDYLKQFPSAGAWLLPQAENGTERSDYAYMQQLISGMRKKRTPEEFLRAIKFKQAGNIYFDRRSTYLTAVEQAREAGDKDLVTQYNNQWDLWSRNFKAAHPLFTEELESSDGRQRRAQTIDEMRTILADPNIPDVDPTQLQALRLGMQSFTNYEQMILVADQDRSATGRDKKEAIKKRYSEYMDTFTKENPSFRSFWISVLRPAAGLD